MPLVSTHHNQLITELFFYPPSKIQIIWANHLSPIKLLTLVQFIKTSQTPFTAFIFLKEKKQIETHCKKRKEDENLIPDKMNPPQNLQHIREKQI